MEPVLNTLLKLALLLTFFTSTYNHYVFQVQLRPRRSQLMHINIIANRMVF